jgi:hypothetical protein
MVETIVKNIMQSEDFRNLKYKFAARSKIKFSFNEPVQDIWCGNAFNVILGIFIYLVQDCE